MIKSNTLRERIFAPLLLSTLSLDVASFLFGAGSIHFKPLPLLNQVHLHTHSPRWDEASCPLWPNTVHFLSPVQMFVPYFPLSSCGRQNTMNHWCWFLLVDPAPGNWFPVFASVHWLVFILNNLFPIIYLFSSLYCLPAPPHYHLCLLVFGPKN